tara:strand:- start:6655 stop:7302 length:648 start_codon:yes stop_codon:yes gene_type:complete
MIKTVAISTGVRLTVISAILLSGCDARGSEVEAYKMNMISDIPTKTESFLSDSKSGKTVHYSLSYQTSPASSDLKLSHSPSRVIKVMERSSSIINSYLSRRGFRTSDCRGERYNLNIFVVNKSLLQQRGRFKSYFNANMVGAVLYGYYDSTPEIKYNSTILVANIARSLNDEILAHEIAHYWWDRLCIASFTKETSEDFARSFQLYYREYYKNNE